MWTCWKALILTLSSIMINCNCFNDWDHSWLVFNEVSDSYLKLSMNCYFSIRNHMTIYIYVDVIRTIMMPSCLYFILSTPLSLNMWTYFTISAFAWGQARSKLGGVDTSILHHAFISIFIALWVVTTHYVTILMPFLSYFIRFTRRGRMPAAGTLGWKMCKYRDYSAQLQKSWTSTKVHFGIY